MVKKAVILLIIAQLFSFNLYANDYNALRKLARGVINLSMAFVEVPRQMIKENEKHGDIAGLVWGTLKGVSYSVGRAALGVYETATFLIPTYKPLVEPEFIFDNENFSEEDNEEEEE